MKKLIVIMLLCASKLIQAQSPAIVTSDKAGWHKISERTVDFKTDKDEIAVIGADKFKSLKFKVTDGAIDLQSLEVYYSEGDVEKIPVMTPVAEGKESKVIDLKGSERELKKVVFVYRTLKGTTKDKAHVELWGMK
jgi:hypothetical protein